MNRDAYRTFDKPRSRRQAEVCNKRVFASAKQVRIAHARAHWRIKAYWCDACDGFHAANGDKR